MLTPLNQGGRREEIFEDDEARELLPQMLARLLQRSDQARLSAPADQCLLRT